MDAKHAASSEAALGIPRMLTDLIAPFPPPPPPPFDLIHSHSSGPPTHPPTHPRTHARTHARTRPLTHLRVAEPAAVGLGEAGEGLERGHVLEDAVLDLHILQDLP